MKLPNTTLTSCPNAEVSARIDVAAINHLGQSGRSGWFGSIVQYQGKFIVTVQQFFFTVVKLCIRFFGALPLILRRFLARGLAGVATFALGRELRFAKLQLQNFLPGTDAKRAARIAKLSVESVAITLFETLNLSPILRKQIFSVQGFDLVAPLLEAGKGALILTAHTGNWDLFGAWAVRQKVPLVAVGRAARGALLHNILVWMRERYGIATLWRGGATGSRACLDLIRQGKFVATLVDQDTRVRSAQIPFFGESANTPSTLVELACKEQIPCFAAFLFREEQGFSVYIDRLDFERSTPLTVLANFSAALEQGVLKYPEQWVWFHKRWRSRPDGERLSSRQYEEWLVRRLVS